jgi:hypothetical protein
VRRRACALVLLPLLLLGAGCRAESAPGGGGGTDQQVSDVESTLDTIESEMAGD